MIDQILESSKGRSDLDRAIEDAAINTVARDPVLLAAAGLAASLASDNQSEGLTDGLPTGDDLDFDKVRDQLEDRGWTEQEVKDLIDSTDPAGTSVDNRGERNDPATVYGSKDKGHVVVNDETGEIVQVSDKSEENWIPDGRIEWKRDTD